MIRRLFVYSWEDRIKAIELWVKYDKNLAEVVRELGYPSIKMLSIWCKAYLHEKETGSSTMRRQRTGRYSAEQKQEALIALCSRTGSAKELAEHRESHERYCTTGRTHCSARRPPWLRRSQRIYRKIRTNFFLKLRFLKSKCNA